MKRTITLLLLGCLLLFGLYVYFDNHEEMLPKLFFPVSLFVSVYFIFVANSIVIHYNARFIKG